MTHETPSAERRGDREPPGGLAGRLRESQARYRVVVGLLRDGQAWLQGQREALEAALSGAPLEASLGVLVRTATAALGEGTRVAFYLASDDGGSLHHLVGMPPDYATAISGFDVSPESLACGLAVATGKPVLTVDVMADPRWEPWRAVAERFDYRGCWSFPILSSAGGFVGTLAVYSRRPRSATEADLELASLLTHTASIIISRHAESRARRQAEEVLRASAAKDRLLQGVSTRMIRTTHGGETHGGELYDVILDAAVALMGADFATLQTLHRDRGRADDGRAAELRLLGQRGFASEAAASWECIRPSSATTCGTALRVGKRVLAVDVTACEWMAGTDDLSSYLSAGIRAAQSTPLLSRTGTMLGMISTHWRRPHTPSDQDLQRLDLLSRQAADLIERATSAAALRASQERQAFLLKLSDALRSLTDPVEIQVMAARVLGEHLDVSRALYCEITDETWVEVRRDYVNGIHSVEGRFRIEEFGATLVEWFRRGEPLVYGDILDDSRFSDTERRALIDVGARANVSVGLVKSGRWVAGFGVHDATPRTWTETDLYLVRETAERTWDAVERARAETALRESEARYRTLFTTIDAGYCVVRVLFDEQNRPLDYVFEEVNPAFEEQTGIASAEGRSMREIAPDHEEHWYETYGRIALTGRPERFENVAEQLHAWYEVYAFRVGEPHERRVAILFTDITERKLSDRRKDEFLATLAHELRNPLAPIRTGLELLKRTSADGSSHTETRVMMERQLTHMVRLIDDLLDVSRISRGKVQLKLERVELQAVVQAAIDAARPFIAAHHHEISVRLPAEPVWLEADPTRLDQVLGNLLTNAAKYTPDGGRVELVAQRARGEVVVSVTDTGAGLPSDQLEAVFELFAQVNRTLNRSQGGLGIGLALVRRLIEMHGGTVTAESPGPGRGSTFTVRLPTAPQPTGGERAGSGSSLADGSGSAGLRVLVVDDNADAADSLGEVLALAGHDTRTAHDGSTAIEIAGTFAPDVVFCDLGMPGMDGYEVARRLRADPGSSRVLLVALTGWGNETDRERSACAGFDLHLTKPVPVQVVQEVLSGAGWSARPRPSESEAARVGPA